MHMHHLLRFVVTLTFVGLAGCTANENAPVVDNEGCLPPQTFVFGPSGGKQKWQHLQLEIAPGALKEDTPFTLQHCPQAKLTHTLTHQFIGQSGKLYSLDVDYPTSEEYEPFKISIPNGTPIATELGIKACFLPNADDDATEFMVMNTEGIATPKVDVDFKQDRACVIVPTAISGLYDKISNWASGIYTKTGDLIVKYVSVYQACKYVSNTLVDASTCKWITNGLSVGACYAAFSNALGSLDAYGKLAPYLKSGVCAGVIASLQELNRQFTGTTLGDLCNKILGETKYEAQAKTKVGTDCCRNFGFLDIWGNCEENVNVTFNVPGSGTP
jgi:hypothetical protein